MLCLVSMGCADRTELRNCQFVIFLFGVGGGGGHRPQRPTESSNPTQHAKGRTGDCPGPRKGTTTRRNVTQGGGGGALLISIPFQPRSRLETSGRRISPAKPEQMRTPEGANRHTCSAFLPPPHLPPCMHTPQPPAARWHASTEHDIRPSKASQSGESNLVKAAGSSIGVDATGAEEAEGQAFQ